MYSPLLLVVKIFNFCALIAVYAINSHLSSIEDIRAQLLALRTLMENADAVSAYELEGSGLVEVIFVARRQTILILKLTILAVQDLYVFLSVQYATNDAARLEVQSDLSVSLFTYIYI